MGHGSDSRWGTQKFIFWVIQRFFIYYNIIVLNAAQRILSSWPVYFHFQISTFALKKDKTLIFLGPKDCYREVSHVFSIFIHPEHVNNIARQRGLSQPSKKALEVQKSGNDLQNLQTDVLSWTKKQYSKEIICLI